MQQLEAQRQQVRASILSQMGATPPPLCRPLTTALQVPTSLLFWDLP